jgi:hypothetical protein
MRLLRKMRGNMRISGLKSLATPAGIEPATNSLEGCCSNPLSYGAVRVAYNIAALRRNPLRACYPEGNMAPDD